MTRDGSKGRLRKGWTFGGAKLLKFTDQCPFACLLEVGCMLHPPHANKQTRTPNKANKHDKNQTRKKKKKWKHANKQRNKEESCKQTNKQTKSHVTDEGLDCIYRSIGLNYGWHTCQQAKLLKVGLENPHKVRLTWF